MLFRFLFGALGVALIANYAFALLVSHRMIVALTETYAYLNILVPFMAFVALLAALFAVVIGKLRLRLPQTPADLTPYLLALILIVLIGIQLSLEFPHLYPDAAVGRR